MKKRLLLKPVFIGIDLLILVGSFQAAYWLRFQFDFLPERPVPAFDLYFQFSFLVGLIGFAMLYSSGLYRLRHLSFTIGDFFLVLRAVTFSSLILMAMNFTLRGYITSYDVETYSRIIVILSWVLCLFGLVIWRLAIAMVFKQLRRRGQGLKNVIVIGTDKIAHSFYTAVKANADFEYRPIGFLCNGTISHQTKIEEDNILGEIDDLPDLVRQHSINEVVLASMDLDQEKVANLIKTCERANVQFSMIPGYFEILTRQMSIQEVADIPIFQLEERIFQRWGRLVKRGMDIGLATIVLLILAPVWLIVAIGIKIGSKGSIFFSHARVGKGENVFQMHKFRSMYEDDDLRRRDHAKPIEEDLRLQLPDELRITPIGRVLRRYSIDEIPQLVNVLKGEMSLVGPRPHMPSEVAHYKEWHRRKFDVLPGMTGLTQVRGRKDLSLDEMIRLDIYYIEHWSPLFDLQILLKTIPAVLNGKGAY